MDFLVAEREMILKAQLDGENVDPYLQAKDLQEADEKRKGLED